MKLFAIVFLIAASTAPLCYATAPSADFFVSPQGSDAWSGTFSEPNPQRTDGPFATLRRARDAVRKSEKSRSGAVVVLVRGGTYRLTETVVFGLKDSGQGESTVTYAAYPGEAPVFTSGREINKWKKVSDALAGLSKEAVGNVYVADVSGCFRSLFDAEGLLPRARSRGFIPLDGSSRFMLRFPKGRLKNWPNVEDVEIVVRPHHAWIVNILPLRSVDEQKQVAFTAIEATYVMDRLHFLKETQSCWVENVLEELDEPGEWVLNTKEGKLYLWPRNDSPVLAPQLTELIRIEGEIDKEGPHDTPVRNLCFRGLTFMHGERYTIASNDAGLQHDWEMHDKASALVRLRGTENCTIEQCRFAHSGGGAIRVDLHGQRNTISGNLIEQIGGTGILMGGYGPGIIADLLDSQHKGEIVPPTYFTLVEGPMTGAAIKRNILYHSDGEASFFDQGKKNRGRTPALAKDANTDYNLYYCAGNPKLSRTLLDSARRDGVDNHSLAADPLFVNSANGDFRFKPDSPALKLGIVPLDMSKIGLVD